jgi:hypothetical protein
VHSYEGKIINEHFCENMPSLFIRLKNLHKHAPFRDQ